MARAIPDQPSRTATSISIVHRFGVGTAVYGEVIPDQPSRIPRAVLRLAARSTPRRKRRRWSSMPRPIPDPTIVTNFLTMTTDRKATLPSESGSEALLVSTSPEHREMACPTRTRRVAQKIRGRQSFPSLTEASPTGLLLARVQNG
jgi:hypothetical protein